MTDQALCPAPIPPLKRKPCYNFDDFDFDDLNFNDFNFDDNNFDNFNLMTSIWKTSVTAQPQLVFFFFFFSF